MRAWMIVPALCLASLTAYARQQDSSQQPTGDPVADAARKARDAKKNAPKPKKVFTDDDVSKSAPAPAPAASPASPTSPTSPDKAGAVTAGTEEQKPAEATKGEDPNGETAWRKRFQEQRGKIAKAEKERDILQREREKAQVQYYPDPLIALKQQNNRGDIASIDAKIEAKRKEIEQLQRGLSDLEDQLRKSGGDPGWAR